MRLGKNCGMEALETRVLLAWGTFPQVIDQDAAVERFPEIDGSGLTIVDIDSGFTGNHEALAEKLWVNPGEVAGNGLDDDGDGYADNVNGWDYVEGDGNIADDQGHGTMTAGIMVAGRYVNHGNGRGYEGDGAEYQGIAPGAKVIAMKVVLGDLSVRSTDVEKALQWVLANHERHNIAAVNMSLSVGLSGWARVADEVRGLWESGVFIGASSGNGGNASGRMGWPAMSDFAASVGASTAWDTVSPATSRGPALDMLAPGLNVPIFGRDGRIWLGGDGTSYSAPFVTAAAVLVRQVSDSFTSNQVLSILRESGKDVYDPALGMSHKRLDLDGAIALAKERAGLAVGEWVEPPVTRPTLPPPGSGGTATVNGQAPETPPTAALPSAPVSRPMLGPAVRPASPPVIEPPVTEPTLPVSTAPRGPLLKPLLAARPAPASRPVVAPAQAAVLGSSTGVSGAMTQSSTAQEIVIQIAGATPMVLKIRLGGSVNGGPALKPVVSMSMVNGVRMLSLTLAGGSLGARPGAVRL